MQVCRGAIKSLRATRVLSIDRGTGLLLNFQKLLQNGVKIFQLATITSHYFEKVLLLTFFMKRDAK